MSKSSWSSWPSVAVALSLTPSILALGTLAACGEEESEPAVVALPVVADGSGLGACTTAQGYLVELDSFTVALADLQLSIEGETHAGLLGGLRDLLLPQAFAHPGHYAGGDVTGELPGRFVVDLFSGEDRLLGEARLAAGQYHGMNFTFGTAGEEDGLAAGDPLLGHTLALGGQATREGRSWRFVALLDIPEGRQMVGAPFNLEVGPSTRATLVFGARLLDPSSEADTVFDGLDFATLDPDGDGQIRIEPIQDAHNILRRKVQVHDHWWLTTRR